MRIVSNGRATHLSYRGDAHPGERWSTQFAELRRRVPAVREALGADVAPNTMPFGIGLRLSTAALGELEAPDTLARLRAWLAAERGYVHTLDGLPHGASRAAARKANTYRPDWSEPARLEHTCRLITLLAALEPPDGYGSIDTLPGAFGERTDPAREAAIVDNLLRAVAHCVRVERDSGVRIALGLEPEPCCLLGTADETVRFFERHLLSMAGVGRLAALADLPAHEARRALLRHLGVCHDVCHSAVEFEGPHEALERYAAAGIDVVKLQLSSALRTTSLNEAVLRRLARFDDPRHRHQVVERRGETLTRHADLDTAIDAARYRLERRSTLDTRLQVPLPPSVRSSAGAAAAWRPIEEPPAEWRVRFHAPVSLATAGMFPTTQDVLADVLARQSASGFCRHLELEACAPELLPAELRDLPPAVAIARELAWVRARL